MRNFKTYWDLIRGYLPRYPGPSRVITQQHVVGGTVTAAVILASLIIANPGARIGELGEQVSSLEILVDSLQAELNVTPGYTRFEFYGFSFEVPENYYLRSSRLGPYQAIMQLAGDGEYYTLVWEFTGNKTRRAAINLDTNLHFFLDGPWSSYADGREIFDIVLGDRESYTFKGYPMRYQNYTFTYGEDGPKYQGIAGTYWNRESNYFLKIKYCSEKDDVFVGFFNFLDSLEYRGPPRSAWLYMFTRIVYTEID